MTTDERLLIRAEIKREKRRLRPQGNNMRRLNGEGFVMNLDTKRYERAPFPVRNKKAEELAYMVAAVVAIAVPGAVIFAHWLAGVWSR